jgi:deoxyribodipyrimidine photo-lyase
LYTKNISILPLCGVLSRIKDMFDRLDFPAVDEAVPERLARPDFADRKALVAFVKSISPGLSASDMAVSEIVGGRDPAKTCLKRLNPAKYGSTRNHLNGAVTRLSPYVRHGVIDTVGVRDRALERDTPKRAEKFIQQLAWREYWQRLYRECPENIWRDIEPYKTGFGPRDYQGTLPDDIAAGATGVACIDQFIAELLQTGYLHNHARLYLASYICHWRRVKWQVGARWFLSHLLDGDPASNNLSWQWVASTFSHKPYYFNLENVAKFSGSDVNTRAEANAPLSGSYEVIYERLFPNLEPKS